MKIEVAVVKEMVRKQFPQWSHLEITPIEKSGHDNRTFHLGNEMAIRIPSGKENEPQVKKEAEWLPRLAAHLTTPITEPLVIGEATNKYPYQWSINKWLEGEVVTEENTNQQDFAVDLACFLKELQAIDASGGPLGGKHNFYRGANLSVYNEETLNAIEALKGQIDMKKCLEIWHDALASVWEKSPVWIHGDVAVGNLLVKNRRLAGVIDFGMLGIGDPACDYVMAWTFFDEKSRAIFKEKLQVDEETWQRAKGWALWKALITFDDIRSKKVIKSLMVEK